MLYFIIHTVVNVALFLLMNTMRKSKLGQTYTRYSAMTDKPRDFSANVGQFPYDSAAFDYYPCVTGLTAADAWALADDWSTWRALRPTAGYAQQ